METKIREINQAEDLRFVWQVPPAGIGRLGPGVHRRSNSSRETEPERYFWFDEGKERLLCDISAKLLGF